MEPELQAVVVSDPEEDSLSAVADLYVANLDMRDPEVLRQAYEQVKAFVPERYRELYAEAAGLPVVDDESSS